MTLPPCLQLYITDRRPLSTVYRRRPSLSVCQTSSILHLRKASNFDTCLTGRAPRVSTFSSFPSPEFDWIVQCRRSDTIYHIILDTLIALVTHLHTYKLLTYLLTDIAVIPGVFVKYGIVILQDHTR